MPARAIHLHPTAPLAPRVLLPGDPGRALQLATELLDRPIMFNHTRGLWGYTGTAADSEPLTIQATGIGGASTAVITDELCRLGMAVAIRVGTAWAGPAGAPLGALVSVAAADATDGVSRALGAFGLLPADPSFAAALAGDGQSAEVISRDLPPAAGELPDGTIADLSSAAFLATANRHGVRAGAVLAIAHDASGDLDVEGLRAAASALGRAASIALGIPLRTTAPSPPPRDDETA